MPSSQIMDGQIKIAIIIGTRPNLIKIAPLIKEIECDEQFVYKFVDTGQHYDYELNRIFVEQLSLPEPIFLNVNSDLPGEQTGIAIIAIEKELMNFKPDISLVIGDTNSTLAGALAAKKLGIKVGHIEAGLRSFNRDMPEEINRIVVDHMSDLLFAPTISAVKNLQNEGIPNEMVSFVYDITVDACMKSYEIARRESQILNELGLDEKEYVVATIHRQENTDVKERLIEIIKALKELSEEITVIFPAHPRTKKMIRTFDITAEIRDCNGSNMKMIKPLGYYDFLLLMGSSACVVTDSGGIQKEALILDIPCVTIRDSTEWTESVDLGANVLVRCKKEEIVKEVKKRIDKDFAKYMQDIKNPYGDGKTAKRIIATVKRYFN